MIQKMMADYVTDILVGYVKAGLIGWVGWFIAAFVYITLSFGTNMELYRVDESDGKKWTFLGILSIIIWPWGLLDRTRALVKYVNMRLHGKE